MKKLPNKDRIVLLMFAVILTACTTTQLTGVWHDEDYTGGPLGSVLVVGLSEDVQSRIWFEQTFTAQFEKYGVKAV